MGSWEARGSVEKCPVEWAGQRAVVTLPAEIDITNSSQIQTALQEALAGGASLLVADMTATWFTASDGIRVLVETHRAAAATGAQLRVVSPGPRVRRVMELTGVGALLDIYRTLEAALDGCPPGDGQE